MSYSYENTSDGYGDGYDQSYNQSYDQSYDQSYSQSFDQSYSQSYSSSPLAPAFYSPTSYPQSEDMSRYDSSEGSPYNVSGPSSPENYMVSRSPASQLLFPSHDDYTYASSPPAQRGSSMIRGKSSSMPRSTRAQSFGSDPDSGNNDGGYTCLVPGCPATPFRRPADLARHYDVCHTPETARETFPCDYSKCARNAKPFTRRDHYREHLREYHKEDIEKRNCKVDDEWFENRNTTKSWWRCQRCLKRTSVKTYGFECPNCKNSCPQARQQARRKH
jgi:hypothetical protein